MNGWSVPRPVDQGHKQANGTQGDPCSVARGKKSKMRWRRDGRGLNLSDGDPGSTGMGRGFLLQLLLHFPLSRVALAKQRHVATLWQFEFDRIGSAFPVVVLGESRPKSARLRPHDRVQLGVVIGIAAEDLDGNHRFFEFAFLSFQTLLDHKPQEPRQALVASETLAAEHALQLRTYGLGIWFKW